MRLFFITLLITIIQVISVNGDFGNTAKASVPIQTIDSFLSKASPAYKFAKTSAKTIVKNCISTRGCYEFSEGVVNKADFLLNTVGNDVISTATGVEEYMYFMSKGKVLKHTKSFGKHLKIIGTTGKVFSHIATALKGISGVLKFGDHVKAGDYEKATEEAFGTAGEIAGGIIGSKLGIKLGVIAGVALAGPICDAFNFDFGAVPCAMLGGAVGGLVGGYLGGMAGSWLGRKIGEAVGDKLYDISENQINECVDRNDGFKEKMCSLIPLGKVAAATTPFGALKLGKELTVDFWNRQKSNRDKESRVKIPAGKNSIHDDSKTKILSMNNTVQIGGAVVTTAKSGQNSLTIINSTGGQTSGVSNNNRFSTNQSVDVTTRIDGNVINRGGSVEIGAIKQCQSYRNGECCLEIRRGMCVTKKKKLSKKKHSCSSYYDEKSGRYCYKYAAGDYKIPR